MRLIDGDRLYETLHEIRMDEVAKYGRIDTEHCCSLSTALYEIYIAPTIEAVKVAQWIEDGYGNGEVVCSNCGEPCATFTNLKPRDRYCKWCGARMEGEKDGR